MKHTRRHVNSLCHTVSSHFILKTFEVMAEVASGHGKDLNWLTSTTKINATERHKSEDLTFLESEPAGNISKTNHSL